MTPNYVSQANTTDGPETSGSVTSRALPVQPPHHGTGQGLLGVLPASSGASSGTQKVATAEPAPRAEPQSIQRNGAIKPVAAHTGWIVQVGALETESEARRRLEAARDHAKGMLGKADPFTETVITRGDKKLYRARFAGLERDEAEAVCKRLKRSDMSCITLRN
jgi:D-alanyl-D-alanine carboxypeptidase